MLMEKKRFLTQNKGVWIVWVNAVSQINVFNVKVEHNDSSNKDWLTSLIMGTAHWPERGLKLFSLFHLNNDQPIAFNLFHNKDLAYFIKKQMNVS